jgi:hypothetical protein
MVTGIESGKGDDLTDIAEPAHIPNYQERSNSIHSYYSFTAPLPLVDCWLGTPAKRLNCGTGAAASGAGQSFLAGAC